MAALDELAKLVVPAGPGPQLRLGVVDSLTSGRPMVKIAGSSTAVGPLKRLSSYTAAVGDVVLIFGTPASLIVLGKVV